MVASSTLPLRKRGSMSATASTGETASATKYGVGVSERRVKSAAVGGSSRASASTTAGRILLNSSAASRRPPPPRSGYHPRELIGNRPRLSDGSSSMGCNQDWGGEGTAAAFSTGAQVPDTTTRANTAMAGVRSNSGGCEDVKLDEVGEAEKEVAARSEGMGAVIAAATGVAEPGGEKKNLHPCPLSGVLDMAEPPLRNHRRSYYNEDDGKVYKVRNSSNESMITDIEEAPREEERLKCIIDFKGKVKHGENCILRGVSPLTPPTSNRNSLAKKLTSDGATLLDNDPDQELPHLPAQIPVSIGIPVRTWHKDNTSDWDPAGVGAEGQGTIASVSGRIKIYKCQQVFVIYVSIYCLP